MRAKRLPQPRHVKPESLVPGDFIMVTFTSDQGVTMMKRGRFATRVDTGPVRHMLTAEGGRLFTWQIGQPHPRITLLEEAPLPMPTLEGIDV